KAPAVLDELENHLREEIQARISSGASELDAFQSAVTRVGTARSLRSEFNKVSGAAPLPVIIGVSIWTGLAILMAILFSGRLFAGELSLLLFTHIFTLTAGYFAALIAGSFGIVYVCWLRWGDLSSEREQSLGRTASRFNNIAAALIVVGFVLG